MRELALSEQDRVLVIAPHPDDETLAAGGVILQAARLHLPVRVLVLTDGDNNPWPQRAWERHWRISKDDRQRWGSRRRAEVRAAVQSLGLRSDCLRFFGLPDQGLTSNLMAGGESIVTRLVAQIEEFEPTVLLAPNHSDLHPDHNAAAVLVLLALSRVTLQRPNLFTYRTHPYRSRVPPVTAPGIVALTLGTEEQNRKRRAIECHRTQLYLSRRRFLAYANGVEPFHIDHPGAQFPVEEGQSSEGQLLLRLHREVRIQRLLRLRLLLLGVSNGRVTHVARLTPTRKTGRGLSIQRGRGGVQLVIGRFRQDAAQQWFCKIESGLGFYDRFGWQLLPLEARTQALPSGVDEGVCCVIPCFNVASYCETIIGEALAYAKDVIAVDDGSTDETFAVLERIQRQHPGGSRLRVVRLERNKGKGAALLAGFREALRSSSFDVLVTLDSDCQHRPADIPRLVAALRRTPAARLAVGERFTQPGDRVPLRSRLGNSLATLLTRFRSPNAPRDTQSGFRAHRRDFVEVIARVVPDGRYETEMAILRMALHAAAPVARISIETVYLDRNRSSHFRPWADSLRVLGALSGGDALVRRVAKAVWGPRAAGRPRHG